MKRPFFSIVIVTYNRSNFLKATLSIILEQSYKDFELIVSDNGSTDDTYDILRAIKDKRLRILRNKKNIGFTRDIKKAILQAKGKYIFTLGDDDFVLYSDTLSRVKNLLERKDYGLVRLNILERKYSGSGLEKKIMNINKDISIAPSADIEKILAFYNKVDIGMTSGIIFKNINITPSKFIVCETYPWFKFVIQNTQNYGAYFLSDYYVVITWTAPTSRQPSWIVRKNNQLEFETYDRALFRLIPANKRSIFKYNYYKNFIRLLPVIKFYSTNNNLIRFVQRLLVLEPSLKSDISLWLMYISSLIIPKSLWLKIRLIYHKINNNIDNTPNLDSINIRYRYLINRFYKFLV